VLFDLPARKFYVFGLNFWPQDFVFLAMLLIIAGLSLSGHGAASHSLQDVEAQLSEREHYLQVVEQPAPEFSLQDATGRTVELADYRDKVVVLWFVFASCTDVCPLHSQTIAGVQDEINRSGLGDRVQFLAITTDPDPHRWPLLIIVMHLLNPTLHTFDYRRYGIAGAKRTKLHLGTTW
jgi:hypothetical protein